MRELDISIVERVARMLPPNLLRALLTRKIPSDLLFAGMSLGHPNLDPPLRLTIAVGNSRSDTTLASFVQWIGLFFDGPLSLKHFYDPSPWEASKSSPFPHECDNANWRFVYNSYELEEDEEDVKNRDAYHVETIMRGLQEVATTESLRDHKDSRNLVNHVFEWLTDYPTDQHSLRGLPSDIKDQHKAKARLAEATNNRIARVGTKGLLT